MGVPSSEVGYTIATTRREVHEVHKGHVVALEKKKSAVISLLPCLDFVTRLVSCAMYVEFRSVFGIVPHTVMQINLWPFRCLNWFLGYLAIRQYVVPISGNSLVFGNTS